MPTLLMKNLSVQHKVILASVVPVLLLAVVMIMFINSAINDTREKVLQDLDASLYEDSKLTVKTRMEIALSAIQPFYEGEQSDEAKAQVADILESMHFDDKNYFFVLDYEGNRIAYNPNPSARGQNILDAKDKLGKPLIRDMIDIAKKGGGHYEYHWINPATNEIEPKISYIEGLDKWGWFIGTGIYVNNIETKASGLEEGISSIANNALFKTITAIVVTLCLVMVFSSFIAKVIVKPIKMVTAMMGKIEQGDLTSRAEIHQNDEIGKFSHSLNVFLDRLHKTIAGIHESADQVSVFSGDLMNITKESAEAVSSSNVQINHINRAASEMTVSAENIAEHGDSVKTVANQANEYASQGSSIVNTNLNAMGDLAEDINQASVAVSALEKRTDEIQSMLSVIHSVTEQTNLLALNAAIEAARAGEQGRGFAVVADEVRTLAMRSSESAAEIQRVIEGLISDTHLAVNAMDTSQKRSEESLQRSQDVAKTLGDIESAMESILEKSRVIAEATALQNQATGQMAANTHSLKDIAEADSGRSDKIHGYSEDLDKMSKHVLDEIAYFKV